MNLYEQTMALLKTTDLSRWQICQQAYVKESWLSRLISGQIKAPDVHKIQRINQVLLSRIKENAK